MGAQNFITLLIVIPVLYTSGFVLVLFERRQGYLNTVMNTLITLFGIQADKFPFLVIFLSIILWQFSFLLGSFSAALVRHKPWDNQEPRNLEEKKTGLPFRAQSAHYNEMEQFTLICVCLMA
eukprot:810817_1